MAKTKHTPSDVAAEYNDNVELYTSAYKLRSYARKNFVSPDLITAMYAYLHTEETEYAEQFFDELQKESCQIPAVRDLRFVLEQLKLSRERKAVRIRQSDVEKFVSYAWKLFTGEYRYVKLWYSKDLKTFTG